MYVDQLASSRWSWHGLSGFPEAGYVKYDGFLNQCDNFAMSSGDRYAAGQVGHVGSISILAFFNNDKIFHGSHFSPACLRILLSVPEGMSMPGLPDTVTVPGFVGCLSCR